eukprot:403356366
MQENQNQSKPSKTGFTYNLPKTKENYFKNLEQQRTSFPSAPILKDGTYDREQVLKNAKFLFDYFREDDDYLQGNTREEIFNRHLYVEDVVMEPGICGMIILKFKLHPSMKDQNGVVKRSVLNEVLDFGVFRANQSFDNRDSMTLKYSIEYYNKIPISSDELLIECRIYKIGNKTGLIGGTVVDPQTKQKICKSQSIAVYVQGQPKL